MSAVRIPGPGPATRGPAPRFWRIARLAAVAFAAAILFGLLMLVSLWFAIPAGIAAVVAFGAIGILVLRIWRTVRYVREWWTRLTIGSDVR